MLLGKVVKDSYYCENRSLVDRIDSSIIAIVDTANEKYNKWTQLKSNAEILHLKPMISIVWSSIQGFIDSCNYQYGRNESIDSNSVFSLCCMLYSTVFGIIMMILMPILYILLYPTLSIYDCASGRAGNQHIYFYYYINYHYYYCIGQLSRILQQEIDSKGYYGTQSIDDEIYNSLKNLANDIKVNGIEMQTGYSTWNYVASHPSSEEDYDVTHCADRFIFQVIIKSSNDVSVSIRDNPIANVNTEDRGDSSINSKDDTYKNLPTEEV